MINADQRIVMIPVGCIASELLYFILFSEKYTSANFHKVFLSKNFCMK